MSLALPHDRARRLRTAGWTLLTLLFLLSVPLLLNASPWTRAAAFLLGGGVVAAFSSLLVRLRRQPSVRGCAKALAESVAAFTLDGTISAPVRHAIAAAATGKHAPPAPPAKPNVAVRKPSPRTPDPAVADEGEWQEF